MTQAFNLSQFANKLNSSGQTDNTGLQNSTITVTAGTGMSGGGSIALGSSATLNNAGVTSIIAGAGISVSASTGAVTITNTSLLPTTFNSVGSYCFAGGNFSSPSSGGNFSAGSGTNQMQANICDAAGLQTTDNILSGTWKWMAASSITGPIQGIAIRVS